MRRASGMPTARIVIEGAGVGFRPAAGSERGEGEGAYNGLRKGVRLRGVSEGLVIVPEVVRGEGAIGEGEIQRAYLLGGVAQRISSCSRASGVPAIATRVNSMRKGES